MEWMIRINCNLWVRMRNWKPWNGNFRTGPKTAVKRIKPAMGLEGIQKTYRTGKLEDSIVVGWIKRRDSQCKIQAKTIKGRKEACLFKRTHWIRKWLLLLVYSSLTTNKIGSSTTTMLMLVHPGRIIRALNVGSIKASIRTFTDSETTTWST